MTKHRKLRKRIDKLMPERGVETRRWFVLDAVPTTIDGEPGPTEYRLRGGKRSERMLALIEQGDPRAGGMGAVIWRVLPPTPEYAEERAATLARRARAQHDPESEPEPDEFPDVDAYVLHDGQPTVAPGLRRQKEWEQTKRRINRHTSAPGLDSPRSAERAGRRIECRVIPLLTPGTRRK